MRHHQQQRRLGPRTTALYTVDVNFPRALSARIEGCFSMCRGCIQLRILVVIGPPGSLAESLPGIQLGRKLPSEAYGDQQARMASRLHTFAADASLPGLNPGDGCAASATPVQRADCVYHPKPSSCICDGCMDHVASDRRQLQEIASPPGPHLWLPV